MLSTSQQATKKANEVEHGDTRSASAATIDDLEATLRVHRSTVASWLTTAARPSNTSRLPYTSNDNSVRGTERVGIGAKPQANNRKKGVLSDGTTLAEERLRRAIIPATAHAHDRFGAKGTRHVKMQRLDRDDDNESRARILGSR